MTKLDILHAYQAYFSGELQGQERLRTATREASDRGFGHSARSRLSQSLSAHQTEQTWWADAAAYNFDLPPLREEPEAIATMEAAHIAVATALERKQAQPGQAIELTPEQQQALNEWTALAAELTAYNDGLSAINETLTQKKGEAASIDLLSLIHI